MGKILVVDDSVTVRTQVRLALTQAGFQVVEAIDGVQGLHQLTTEHFAAVVCDVNMPNMGGLEMLAQLPESRRGLPIIMLTTEGEPVLMQRARELGAKGWLLKPFKADLLIAAIRKLTAKAA